MTVAVTIRFSAYGCVVSSGVTVTVGDFADWLTVTPAVPEALLNFAALAESGVYFAVSESEPGASDPAGIVMVTEPELSIAADEV